LQQAGIYLKTNDYMDIAVRCQAWHVASNIGVISSVAEAWILAENFKFHHQDFKCSSSIDDEADFVLAYELVRKKAKYFFHQYVLLRTHFTKL